MTYFKRNIEHLMRLKGFRTETEFADFTGIPQPTLNRWRTSKHANPNKNTMAKLVKSFGISESELKNSDLAQDSVFLPMTEEEETHNIRTSPNFETNNMQAETIKNFYKHDGNTLVACDMLLNLYKMAGSTEAQIGIIKRIVDLLNSEIDMKEKEIDKMKHVEKIEKSGMF